MYISLSHGIIFSIGVQVDVFEGVPMYAAAMSCRPCKTGSHFLVDTDLGPLLIKTTSGYFFAYHTTTGQLVLSTNVGHDDYNGIDIETFNARTGTYFTVRTKCGCKLLPITTIIPDDDDE